MIGGYHTENYAAGISHIPADHSSGNLVDVLILTIECNSGESWKIDDRQVGASIGGNFQDDGLIDDVLVGPTHFISQIFDSFLDLRKVFEGFTRYLFECSNGFLSILIVGHSDLERSSGDDALSKV